MAAEKICHSYCGAMCINGGCPIANREEYAERGYDITHSCAECIYYEGCEDCCFNGTDYCTKEVMNRGGRKKL